MIFYKIEADVELKTGSGTENTDHQNVHYIRHDEDCRSMINTISDEADKMYSEKNKKCFLFVNRADNLGVNDNVKKIRLRILAVSESLQETERFIKGLDDSVSFKLQNIDISETTSGVFIRNLRHSDHTYVDFEAIMSDFDIPDTRVGSMDTKEYLMTKKDMSLAEYETRAKEYLCDSTLLPELKRIFVQKAHSKGCVNGVPVQYMICIKNSEIREKVVNLLQDALYDAGRFQNSRLYKIIYKEGGFFGPSDEVVIRDTWDLMKVCKGSLVEIDYQKGLAGDNKDVKHAGDDVLEALGDCIKYYRNEIQTFFCIPGEIPGIESMIMDRLGNVPVIKITEDQVNGIIAEEYLRMMAESDGLNADDSLFAEVRKAIGTYDVSDLKKIYDRWYNDYVRSNIYPGYAEIKTAEEELAQKLPDGCAYEKLNKMTGLKEAKNVIDSALDYYKAQKIFKEKGVKIDRPAMHMVFTGNPGTAKTTVARLFASILKENGILSEGKLFELGRADLVGQYVGWTAPIVKRRFAEAKGSVLFIDEAYSLVDGKDGLYGDEAINTIVAEMENNREDMVVIFAGYPQEMETFLEKNPGLRSRIAFHVPFEDYSAEELFDIAGLIAEDKGVRLDSGVKEKLVPVFEKARSEKDFGNGRFVRNMIEKAKMKQMARLVRSELKNVTKDDCETLIADDFDEPANCKKDNNRQIGFAV